MVVTSELSVRLSFYFLLATLLSPRASSRLRISKLSYQLKPLKAGSNKPTELKDPGRVTSTSCGLLPQFFFCRDNGKAFCVHTYLSSQVWNSVTIDVITSICGLSRTVTMALIVIATYYVGLNETQFYDPQNHFQPTGWEPIGQHWNISCRSTVFSWS